MTNQTRPKGMKIFPRNLTARAAYVVRGNPVVSRPESGADNTHPGLEFDMRNIDRGFFPGLQFDFQFGIGARLSAVQSPWSEIDQQKNGRRTIDPDADALFLWYICGRFGDQPESLAYVDAYGVDGYDVLRKVHDLETGPLAIVVGVHPEELRLGDSAGWIAPAMALQARFGSLMTGSPEERRAALGNLAASLASRPQLETFCDKAGRLQFAILIANRAPYLTSDGVVDLRTVVPGGLTQGLCSPWQWDFADCGCYYWAASRPDMVTVAGEDNQPQAFNYLRIRNEPAVKTRTWQEWMDPTQIKSQPQMILDWEKLPLVIDDREVESQGPRKDDDADSEYGRWWNRRTIEGQFRHLAEVEHTLCVNFLYAHYSVNAPYGRLDAGAPPDVVILSQVANEIFQIAIDEMRHFRWVNEALAMLGRQPVFTRTVKFSKPPRGFKVRQQQMELKLDALTPQMLQGMIDIESPSQKDGSADEIAGLYTHILLSLNHHKDRRSEYSDEIRGRLQEIVKLIIDEGHGHWTAALRMQKLLSGFQPRQYLRYRGAPVRRPKNSDAGRLQILGDHYYQMMLEILRLAFKRPPDARGDMIRWARRVMHNLHEVGHLLGGIGEGLLFTPPQAGASPGRLDLAIPGVLAKLRSAGSPEIIGLARRHEPVASELRNLFDDIDEEDRP